MRKLFLIFFLAAAAPVFAATHYISTSGADTNAGTSEGSPWAHMPGMQTCTNNCSSYTPAAGDKIVLRGCDDWGNSNFPINWTWSGSSGNLITITVDKTWFNTSTCSLWNRPIFDAGGTAITNTGAECAATPPLANNAFLVDTANYQYWGWIEATGFHWTTNCSSAPTAGVGVISGQNLQFDNWYIHNWTWTTGVDIDQLFYAPGNQSNTGPAPSYCGNNSTNNCTFSNGVVNNQDGYTLMGNVEAGGFVGGMNVKGTIFNWVTNALKIYGNGEFAYNNIQNVGINSISGQHPNSIEAVGNTPNGSYSGCAPNNCILYLHDNYVAASAATNNEAMAVGNPYEVDFAWNNTFYIQGGGEGPYIPQGSTTNLSVYFWNNTVWGNTGCLWIGGGTIVNYYVQNNFCINNNGTTIYQPGSGMTPSGGTSVSNNLAMTTATATSQGYTAANNFAPTLNTNSTVGAGTNLSTSLVTTWPGQISGASTTTLQASNPSGTVGACVQQIVATVIESVCPPTPNIPRTSSPDEGSYQFTAGAQLNLNASSSVGAISPYIYCTVDPNGSFGTPDTTLAAIVKWPCARAGGDAFSNYNGAYNSFNSGGDNFYLQGYPFVSGTPYQLVDDFYTNYRTYNANAQMLATIPINPYVTIDDKPRCSWQFSVYGLVGSQAAWGFLTAIYPSNGAGLTVNITSVNGGGGVTGVAVNNGGTGWAVNDEAYLFGVAGQPIAPGTNYALIKVTSVSGGAVTGLSIVSAGSGLTTYTASGTGDGCGNGNNVTNTTLAYNYATNTTTIAAAAVAHYVGKWGACSAGGFCNYELDNEPSGWANTHGDWQHPNSATYTTIASDGETYANAIKTADTSTGLKVLGPGDYGDCGWTLGCYVSQNLVPTSDPALVYYMKSFSTNDTGLGKRTLDCVDEHFSNYTGTGFGSAAAALQGTDRLWNGNFTAADDASVFGTYNGAIDTMSLNNTGTGVTNGSVFSINGGTTGLLATITVTSVSSGHIATYTLTGNGAGYTAGSNAVATTLSSGAGSGVTVNILTISPYGTPGQILPRFTYYANKFYPGTAICDSEIDWTYYSNGSFPNIGGSSLIDMLGLTDMYGLFGQYGVYLASRFDSVSAGDAQAFTYEMFLNYDGSGHKFGDTAISSFSSNPDNLSIYGATRSSDNALTVIVINKTASTITTPIGISGYAAASPVSTYTYSSANTAALVSGSTSTATLASGYAFPAYSATELVLTPSSLSAPQAPSRLIISQNRDFQIPAEVVRP